MTQDVKQWLAEIKLLQNKVAQYQQERDDAFASSSNWRNLYETEAKQRRTEANLARQTIETLKAELQSRQPFAPDLSQGDPTEIEQRVAQIQTVDDLKQHLVQVLQECDRLTQALKTEQSAHAHTRRSLTTALGDTVDRLNHERAARRMDPQPAAPPPVPKIPSLELPPIN